MQLKRSSQRGDTIVEVLIAIAVVGAAISGAYVFVSSNTKNNQAAQERSSAVKVAETQLELLRSYVAEGNPLPSGRFCFDGSASTVVKHTIPGALPASSNTPASYPLDCQFDDGQATDKFVGGIQASGPNRYTVFVTWDAATGKRAQVSIGYKVYNP